MSQPDVQQPSAAPPVAPAESSVAAPVETPTAAPSLSDLRSQLSGGVEAFAPKQETPTPEIPAEIPAVEEPAAPVSEENADVPAAVEPAAEEVAVETASPAVVFTEDMTAEAVVAQGQSILEQYDLPEDAAAYIAALEARAAAPPANPFEAIAPVEVVEKTFNALKGLASYEKDPITGVFEPKTQPVIDWLKEDYKGEYPELVKAVNTQPSQKYQGMTQFQEFLVDYGQLDQTGLANLELLLENKGQMPVPSFTPEGVDPKASEAYWQSPNRAELDAAIASNVDVVNDEYSTPQDKQQALRNIEQINLQLHRIQLGINASRQQQEAVQRQAAQAQEQMQEQIGKSYRETSVGLLRNLADEVSASFSMFDKDGAKIASLGLTKLVEAALTDDEWAAYAQEDLTKQGIKFDWKQGRAALDSLYAAEERAHQLQARGANPLAVQAAQTDKANALKELKRLQKDFMGQLTKKMVAGNTQVLKQKAAITKKDPSGQRIAPANAPTSPSEPQKTDDYSKMGPEELRSRLGELQHQMRQQGITASL